ncbi:MAG TPA: hypothetical protein VD770_02520 [Coxiellaceae bacterium]|nr:hypothetical protein [Coxiellaceae bacterium]
MSAVRNKILAILRELMLLISDTDEKHWLDYFGHVVSLFENGSHDYELIKILKKLLDNSLSSFSQLVLHGNGQVLIEQNEKLEFLRKALSYECNEAQHS